MTSKKPLIIGLPVLSFCLSLGIAFSYNEVNEALASSYTVNSVPTTINLNDTSATDIRSYYSSLNSLADNEKSGTNLLKNLKPILKNGQKYYSYGKSPTKAVWQAYEIVDRDWAKSPASEISGYNAVTNTITGYVYGTSNTDVGSNPYVHALYVNRDVENETKAWGNHNQNQWGINQEHIWAKSSGFENDSPAAGARGDLMHLWAGNGRVNGDTHNNYYYGYVDTTKSYNDAGTYASTLSGNRRGYSKTLGGSVTVFEPQDSDKGDIARAIFYMAARYNYLSGSDSDGIDAGNPNLEIVNDITSWQKNGYQSTTTSTGKMGILQDLLEWNRIDPPDEWEIHRNNLLYNNFTNNRNPFIDFPQWADVIWGSSTASADPSSDAINNKGLSISSTDKIIAPGYTSKISASTVDNSTISWNVVNTSVATVSKATSASGEEITITGVSQGTTKLVASATVDGANYEKECTLEIRTPTTKEAIATDVEKIEFQIGNSKNYQVDILDGSNYTVTVEDTSVATVVIEGGKIKITPAKAGTTKLKITATVYGQQYERTLDVTIQDDGSFKLDTKTIIIIAAIGVGVILILVIVLATSKKARSKAKKIVKKQVNSQIKKSTSTKSTAKKATSKSGTKKKK